MRFLTVLFATALMLCAALTKPAGAAELIDDIERELEYVHAVVEQGVQTGDMKLLEKAHRTLANLELTTKELTNPTAKTAVQLASAYFYVQMSDSVLLLSLSRTTNPGGFQFDPALQAEHFFHEALETARRGRNQALVGDAYFFIGLGYDMLRVRMLGFGGAEKERFFEAARAHLEKAVGAGTSFGGAGAAARRIYRLSPESPESVIPESQFSELHTAICHQASMPRVAALIEKAEAVPIKKDENVYIDYKWRFSVRRLDNTWVFDDERTPGGMKLLIQRGAGKPKAGAGVQITVQPARKTPAGKGIDEAMEQSVAMLTSAGYKVAEQRKFSFKGRDAWEVKLTHTTTRMDGGEGDGLTSKQYMLVVVSADMRYIVTFNALEQQYDALFPELMETVNTFTPF